MYVYGFRFYFTPLTGVLFAFPSRYWFTIGQLGVFSLGGWSPHLQSRFLVSRPTCCKLSTLTDFSNTGLSPSLALLPRQVLLNQLISFAAASLSLAATWEISFDFFSSGYLDVSVPLVRLPNPMYSGRNTCLMTGGFPHSDTVGS